MAPKIWMSVLMSFLHLKCCLKNRSTSQGKKAFKTIFSQRITYQVGDLNNNWIITVCLEKLWLCPGLLKHVYHPPPPCCLTVVSLFMRLYYIFCVCILWGFYWHFSYCFSTVCSLKKLYHTLLHSCQSYILLHIII